VELGGQFLVRQGVAGAATVDLDAGFEPVAVRVVTRKTLGWKTPAEALNEQLLLIQQGGVATIP
jgi:hypothetical protein